MKRIGHLTTTVAALATLLFCIFMPVHARAAGASVLITGLQTGSSTNASSEYVQIANVTAGNVDVGGWKLQYKSATGTSWATKATLATPTVLEPAATLLLASSDYVTAEPHQTLGSGLAATGGHVQLIDTSGTTVDLLGWGTANAAETTPAPAPQNDETLARKTDSSGAYIDTNNNSNDFAILGDTAVAPVVDESDSGSSDPAPVVNIANDGLAPPLITELLPNPASPQTDASDEFVELYNPNSVTFDLSGYQLQTGDTYTHHYAFPDGTTLQPFGYTAFTSADTKLSLSNTSSKARLIDPSGQTLSEVPQYANAADGRAWALFDTTWQWTTEPTPNAENVLSVPSGSSTKAASSSKSTSTKAASTTKKPASKTTSTTTKKTTTAGAGTGSDNGTDSGAPSPVHPLVLAGVGTAAVGYAVYEYRKDVLNRLFQLKRHLKVRRFGRAKL